MVIITTFIGLILVYLILSLLASSVQETIAGWFSLRAKNLNKALKKMLINESYDKDSAEFDKSLFTAFQKHSHFNHISPHNQSAEKTQNPSYMTAETFANILLHTLDGSNSAKLEKTIGDMNNGLLKDFLENSLKDADKDLTKFRTKIESWYNNVMDRASGWYKRTVHNNLLLIGFIIALGMNADTFAIYSKLSLVQPSTAEENAIQQLAQEFVKNQYATDTQAINNMSTENNAIAGKSDSVQSQSTNTFVNDEEDLEEQIVSLRNTLSGDDSPLGLGWTKTEWEELKKGGFLDWFSKIMGIIISAFAISLGAPFWFDLLQKFINIRNAGPVQTNSVIPTTSPQHTQNSSAPNPESKS